MKRIFATLAFGLLASTGLAHADGELNIYLSLIHI